MCCVCGVCCVGGLLFDVSYVLGEDSGCVCRVRCGCCGVCAHIHVCVQGNTCVHVCARVHVYSVVCAVWCELCSVRIVEWSVCWVVCGYMHVCLSVHLCD